MIKFRRIQQSDGTIRTEWVDENYKLHRIDGPAMIEYNKFGGIYRKIWFYEHQWHRFDGPAFIEYNQAGVLTREQWYILDNRHRLDGPSMIIYNDGKVANEYWYINDSRIKDPPKPWPLTKEQQVELKLKYG